MKAFWVENKRNLIVIGITILAIILFRILMQHKVALEIYHGWIFRPISFVFNKMFSFTVWSIGEIIIYFSLGLLIFLIIKQIVCLFRTKRFVFRRFLHNALNFASVLGIVYMVFMVFFGLNYYKEPFSQKLSYDSENIELEEVITITRLLTQEANLLRGKMKEDSAGVMKLRQGYKHYLRHGLDGYHLLDESYNVPVPHTSSAKRLLISDIFSYMGVGGVFMPHTFEANVNLSIPDPLIPALICHELAHLSGYATEDEANYISFLTSRANPNPEFKYSGYLMALRYFLGQLAKMDRAAYEHISEGIHPGIVRDIQAHHRFWEQYKSPVERVSSTIYNQYLKANNQPKGIMSYHEMIKLVIGEYRKKNNL